MWIPQPKQIWLPGQPKPPAGTMLDPLLCDGLVGCWLFNEGGGSTAFNLAQPKHATWSDGSVSYNNRGLNLADSAATQRVTFDESIGKCPCDITVIVRVTPTRASGKNVHFMSKWVSGRDWNNSWCIGGNYINTPTDYYPTFAVSIGIDVYEASHTVQWQTGVTETFVGVRRGNALFLYRNGLLVATTTGLSGETNTPTTIGKIGDFAGASALNTIATYHYAMIYNRALSAQEIQRLHEMTAVW